MKKLLFLLTAAVAQIHGHEITVPTSPDAVACQSDAHLYFMYQHGYDVQDIFKQLRHAGLYEMFAQAHARECELNDAGYTVVYHGQQSARGFLQIFTREYIAALAKKNAGLHALPEQYLFIQNTQNVRSFVHGLNLWQRMSDRAKHFLMMWNWVWLGGELVFARGYVGPVHSGIGSQREHYRLSVNAFLFGNTTEKASCTWQYVLENDNEAIRAVCLKVNFFQRFGIGQLWDQFGQEVQALEEQYANLFKHGRLLQIAIPNKLVDSCVYSATGMALRVGIAVADTVFWHVRPFLDFVRVHPERIDSHIDRLEFALPLRGHIMNPRSGVKVIAYESAPEDQQAYAQCIEDIRQLALRVASAS